MRIVLLAKAKFQKLSIYLTRPLNHGYDEDKSLKLNQFYAIGHGCMFICKGKPKFLNFFPGRGGVGAAFEYRVV